MNRLVFLLLSMFVGSVAWSQTVTLALQDEPLASALRQIDQAQHERRIVFVLNDLDSLRVTRSIIRRSAFDAVAEVCEGYPILISEHDADIFVEYIRPPVRLLPNATITRRPFRADADGYTLRLHQSGMTGLQLLAMLPYLTVDDGTLLLNGQAVDGYYLNGERLADAYELSQLPSDEIEEVRVNYRTRTVHITLRKPTDGGFYGSLMAEADCYQSSAEGRLGGVWYSRYGRTSIYNRLGASLADVTHSIRQFGYTAPATQDLASPHSVALQDSRLSTDEKSLSNRFSLTRQLTDRRALGFSYYVASRRGNALVRKDDAKGFVDFSGSNRHIDQELTLRYNATFGRRDTKFETVADYYSRQTTSENVSLYGAGVGTEVGESPSISMWKLAAELHHPFSPHHTLHASYDLRYFVSHYDPTQYLSNFKGSPAFLYAMNQHGFTQKSSLGISSNWQRLRLEAGLALQYHIALQEILDKARATDDVHPYDYMQIGFFPYLQLYCPFGEQRQHRLTLSYQRDMEDLPYAAMSPAVRWSDAFNYSTGNRRLRSPEVQRWMVNASGWEGRLSLTASYLPMHNEIFWQSAISSGQTDVYYTQPVNLASTHLWMLQAEASLRPTTRWQMKLQAHWQLRPEDTTIGEAHYSAHHLRQHYSAYNLIDLGRGWRILFNAMYSPTYRIFDRTYHSRHNLQGEVQRYFCNERLQCALTFRTWGSDRRLDRQIGTTRVTYSFADSQPHLGLRATWRFDGGRRVKVGTVEGAQHYNDIKDD